MESLVGLVPIPEVEAVIKVPEYAWDLPVFRTIRHVRYDRKFLPDKEGADAVFWAVH